jgi:ribosomal protein L37AE/L43A
MAERLSIEEMAQIYREAQCPSGKVPHLSRHGATIAAKRMNETPPKYGTVKISAAYQCPHCGLWHVGR